jgi:hypothetical protein
METKDTIQKIPEVEYTKTDSKYSSMRLAFFWMVKTLITISVTSVIAIVVFSALGLKLDAASLIAIIASLGVTTFGGKALQSRAETIGDASTAQTDKITQTLQSTLTSFAQSKQPKIEAKPEDPNDVIAPIN